MYVIRINSDGSKDNSIVINNIAGCNGYDDGNSIILDSTGKIYGIAESYNGSNWDMYVIKIE